MLSVVLLWCYMAFTMSVIGYGFLQFFTAHFLPEYRLYQVKHIDSYLFCGLVCTTVYAQLFSLVYKVGFLANLILCGVCFFIIWKYRRKIVTLLSEPLRDREIKRGRMIALLFLFFLFAYGASRGQIHYDTSLYHAQSIRWYEEYGVVRGLGNLHCRLAYNSSSFAVSALYSMAFLGGQSYHCVAGFLAFLLAKVCFERVGSFWQEGLKLSDFARVMAIYYLVNLFDEMVSPASDYFMVLLAFYIIIRWLALMEENENAILPYALLCVMGVFLMTVKLSAALILLLTVYPAYYLVKEKRIKEIIGYLVLGIFTALPYFIRNVVISGWLVYPFTGLDFFRVKWKIPREVAEYDAREIQVWGRGYTDVARYDIGIREWMPDWFKGLAGSDKAFVALALFSLILLCIYTVGMMCRIWRRHFDILLVQWTVAFSFLFWLCTSPLIRYGCVYVYLMPAIVLGGIYVILVRGGTDLGDRAGGAAVRDSAVRRVAGYFGKAAVLLVVAYKIFALGKEVVLSYTNDYWIAQKDYENFEVSSYEIEGVTFYYPKEGDRVGYESFPSSPARAEFGLLGDGLADGFYHMERE